MCFIERMDRRFSMGFGHVCLIFLQALICCHYLRCWWLVRYNGTKSDCIVGHHIDNIDLQWNNMICSSDCALMRGRSKDDFYCRILTKCMGSSFISIHFINQQAVWCMPNRRFQNVNHTLLAVTKVAKEFTNCTGLLFYMSLEIVIEQVSMAMLMLTCHWTFMLHRPRMD